MGEQSKIEWTDNTFNGWTGCTKVSPGRANCCAEGWAKRSGIVQWGPGQPRRRTSDANWKLPLKWNREAGELAAFQAGSVHGTHRRPRVFCSLLADWLDDEVPIEWLADLLALIHATPNLDWLLLSKRPENWKTRLRDALECMSDNMKNYDEPTYKFVREWIICNPPKNVWIGASLENQNDKRIRDLLSIPAKVRFLSCEPLLEGVDLRLERLRANKYGIPSGQVLDGSGGVKFTSEGSSMIHWVICGGESGPKARPMNPDWARSLRDQCQAAGVPFFMKQMGGTRKPFAPIPDDLEIKQFPTL